MSIRILHGDCRAAMRVLADNSVDSIVCDPPYHLTTGKKGGTGQATLNLATPQGRSRIGTGFMGLAWDGGDVAFDPITWREARRVLKPGGHVLAFGGTRTYHRLVCAIEDAGFEVRDMLAWLYGTGFPKGTDKAKIPEEWKGWNTALKPAIEPICMARKPMEGTLAENLRKWGTGALWIDGCLIDLESGEELHVTGAGAIPARHDVDTPRTGPGFVERDPTRGRHPANVMHDGSDEVLAQFPRDAGAAAPVRGDEASEASVGRVTGKRARVPGKFHDDRGSAARFFYCPKASRTDRNEGLEGMEKRDLNWSSGTQSPGTFQSPGTNRSVENHHPTVKPTELLRWCLRLVTPPGGTTLDFFVGSGSTLKAARIEGLNAIGCEREAEYVEISCRRARRPGANNDLFDDVTVETIGDAA